jgi:hypothetical protein
MLVRNAPVFFEAREKGKEICRAFQDESRRAASDAAAKSVLPNLSSLIPERQVGSRPVLSVSLFLRQFARFAAPAQPLRIAIGPEDGCHLPQSRLTARYR